MDLLIASGSLSDSSQSNVMARHAAEAAAEKDVETTFIDPRDLDLQFCDGRDWDSYNDDVTQWQQQVQEADCYIFAVPVYNWSYAGVFKNMIDLIPPGGFGGDIAGLMGKGGGMKGFLILQREMRSLMSYFDITTVPQTVFASNSDFDGDELVSEGIQEMIPALVDETITMTRQVSQR